MATRKQTKKPDVKVADPKPRKSLPASGRVPAKPVPAITKPALPAAPRPGGVMPATKRPAGPSARTCPLVLDGELDAADFSPSDCLTCGEFDCRYCEAADGSGALRSRLFAGSEDGGEDGEDGWGGDLDFDGGEETGGDDESGEEDLY